MNKNEVTIFNHEEFGRVRTLIIDNEPWFSARDVAKCLNYVNTKKAILDNVDKEDTMGLTRDEIQGYLSVTLEEWGKISNHGMKFINESGLYSLILSSLKPEAKRFKKWITSEVLPSIRKTGQYSVNSEPQQEPKNKIDREIAFMRFSQSIVESKDLPTLYKQTVTAYMLNEMSGKYLLPLPEVETTYTATEIGNQLGISKQMVGRIANKHKLKTDKYGVQVMDLLTNGKQVPNFRYNEVGKNKIIEIIEKQH